MEHSQVPAGDAGLPQTRLMLLPNPTTVVHSVTHADGAARWTTLSGQWPRPTTHAQSGEPPLEVAQPSVHECQPVPLGRRKAAWNG